MNKLRLVHQMMQDTGLQEKQARMALESFLSTVSQVLIRGESLRLVGFGSFKTRVRKARMGHLPKSNRLVEIPAALVPSFMPGKALKEKLLLPVTPKAKIKGNKR